MDGIKLRQGGVEVIKSINYIINKWQNRINKFLHKIVIKSQNIALFCQ